MLIAVIKAVARPVFDAARKACRASALLVSGGHRHDGGDIGAEGAGVDHVGAEVEGQVSDWRPGDVEAKVATLPPRDHAHTARLFRIARGGDCHLIGIGRTGRDTALFGELDVAGHQQRNGSPRLEVVGAGSKLLLRAGRHAMDAADMTRKRDRKAFGGQVAAKR